MKHFSLCALLLFAICPLFGQNAEPNFWTDLSVVANATKIDLQIDFSEAEILGEDFADFVANEADWSKSEPEIRKKFIRAFNEEANDGPYPHRLGTYPDAEYRMLIKVTRVTDKGSDVNADLYLLNASDEVVFFRRVNGERGRIGSVCNLMEDAFEDLGESLGSKFYWCARVLRHYLGW